MINFVVHITIQQVTPYINGQGIAVTRNQKFTLDECASFEIYSTWKNLTDTATVVFPKNIYVTDQYGQAIPWGSNNWQPNNSKIQASQKYIGGFPSASNNPDIPPLFMRGDQITIEAGYKYPSFERANGTYQYETTTNVIFEGYIAEVDAKIPVKLKCEDNMWKCKQVAAINKNYPAAVDNMGDILKDFTAQTGFEVERAPSTSAFYQLNIGNFRIMNETWAKVFDRLRKDKRLYFYFRKNVLRGGGIVYYPEDQGNPIPFVFQKNIIKDELAYKLKTDINIGAKCYSVNKLKQNKTNATGNSTQVTSRLETTVGADKEASTEYFTFFFTEVNTIAELKAKGNAQLAKYYYAGYHGKFTTLGLPDVIHGNIVNLTDNILPERTGNYLVKGVKKTFSVTGGFRQEPELHFRTDNLSASDLNNGL